MDDINFNEIEHPDSGKIHTLGILGIIFTFVAGIVGLILNIICISNANKALKEINAKPNKYTQASINKIKSGRTCSIVGLSIQGAIVIIVILVAIGLAIFN